MCGDEGTRTLNPCLAKAVLCQLSYVPESVGVTVDLPSKHAIRGQPAEQPEVT
jgi:hypothetical protein